MKIEEIFLGFLVIFGCSTHLGQILLGLSLFPYFLFSRK